MNLRNSYLSHFVDLLFPRLCQACKTSLVGTEELICTNCLFDLPYTNFHQQADNIVARQFWGKIPLQYAYALLYFEKGGKVQHLIHQFKYKDMPKIGDRLGQIAGEQLLQVAALTDVDHIIPVPLHRSRLRERGYNQSTHFANGLAQRLQATVLDRTLIRTVRTSTQTRKSRFDRYLNMQEVFALNAPELLHNKHILLVDDIVTTGSTLEACAHELLAVPGLRLSIATIAYAL